MKTTRLLAMAAALTASVAIPAIAQPWNDNGRGPGPGQYGPPGGQFNYPDWDRIGSVDFGPRPEREIEYTQFGGRMERLSFRAQQNDVICRNISATFNNGRTRSIFNGTLPVGRDIIVDLPGAERQIRQINFDCRSATNRGTRVDIAADIGEYRAEWRANPQFARIWANLFNWPDDRPGPGFPGRGGPGRGGPDDRNERWVSLSTETFQGPRDVESSIPGMRGRSIESIGIRPIDGDAICMRVTATFENGRTSDLYVNRGAVMQRGRMYEVDLPGNQRNLERLDLMCRANRGRSVSVEVLGNR